MCTCIGVCIGMCVSVVWTVVCYVWCVFLWYVVGLVVYTCVIGCMSRNLEVVPTDSPQLTVYSGLRLRARSKSENDSHVGERFGFSCALILTVNSVGCTQIYL